jgi:hypothetical protein
MLINIFCIKINASTTSQYLIILDRQGGTGGTEAVVATLGEQLLGRVMIPTHSDPNMQFAGYFTAINSSNSPPNGIRYYNAEGHRVVHEPWTGSQDITLYAYWVRNFESITLSHGNGTDDFETLGLSVTMVAWNVFRLNLTANIIPPTITPSPFHSFYGYFEGPNAQGMQIYNEFGARLTEGVVRTDEHKIYHAFYAITRFSLVFEKDGGNGGSDNMIIGTTTDDIGRVGRLPTTITPPTREGFTFNGYFSEENGAGEQLYNATGTRTNNIAIRGFNIFDEKPLIYTLNASWIPNNYVVMLNRSGGTGGTGNLSVFFGQMPDNLTPPMRNGFNFVGYFTETDGEGTKYFDFDGKAVREWALLENTTLYAHWTLGEFTVTFNSNGGSPVNSITAIFGGTITAPSAPIRENHGFGGWYLENTRIQFPYTVSGDVTLTAQWVEDGKCVDCEKYEIDCICKHCDICDELTHPKDECSCKYCEVCYRLNQPIDECVCAYCTVCDELIHPKDECICEYCNICDELKGDCICKYCEGCDKLEHPENNCVCCITCELVVCVCCKDCTKEPCECPEPPDCVLCMNTPCNCPPPLTYQITFNSNGGSAVTPITIDETGIITHLPTPNQEGHTFLGWFTTEYDTADFVLGRILPGDNRNPTIGDVLELLKFLAGIQGNVIAQGGQGSRSWNASLITPASITANRPGINDALEILKRLAGIDGILSNLPPPPQSQPIIPGTKIIEDMMLIARWEGV